MRMSELRFGGKQAVFKHNDSIFGNGNKDPLHAKAGLPALSLIIWNLWWRRHAAQGPGSQSLVITSITQTFSQKLLE